MLAIRVEAVTSSKSRFKLLPLIPSSSGKLVWGLFQPVYSLDTFLGIPPFKTHSFKHILCGRGNGSEQTRQNSCFVLHLSFLCTQGVNPSLSSPSKNNPLLFLEKPDKYHYMKAQIKHFFFWAAIYVPGTIQWVRQGPWYTKLNIKWRRQVQNNTVSSISNRKLCPKYEGSA